MVKHTIKEEGSSPNAAQMSVAHFPFPLPFPTEENPVIDLSETAFGFAAGFDFNLVLCPYSFVVEVSVDDVIEVQAHRNGIQEKSWVVDKRAKKRAYEILDDSIGNLHSNYVCMAPCKSIQVQVQKRSAGAVGGYTGVAEYEGYGGDVIGGVYTYYVSRGFARSEVKLTCGK